MIEKNTIKLKNTSLDIQETVFDKKILIKKPGFGIAKDAG